MRTSRTLLPIPKEVEEQAKLPLLGYTSPLEALGEHFHSSPELIEALNPGANFQRAGTKLNVPNVMVMPPARAANVVVSKSESVRSRLRCVGNPAGLLCRHHRQRARSAADRRLEGQRRTAQPEVPLQPEPLLGRQGRSDEKATLPPGPNNPVGLVWIDLSKEHYGIHGTPEPGKVGHAESHGCIRLTNWDALELASMVKPGTPATLKE